MDNHALILAEILFLLVLISSVGIYFLAILESIKRRRAFRGVNAIVLSLLISTLIVTIPIVLMMTPSPCDVDPARGFIIDYSLWPPLIVWVVVSLLGLLVVAAGTSSAEDKLLDGDALDPQTKSIEKPKEEKSAVGKSEAEEGKGC